MATKNLGQVAGLWIGTSAPSNTSLIWFDSTPAIRAHKVYSARLGAWTVLDQNTISAIAYSDLRNLANSTGLTQGSWYKITDKSNALALAVTTTKIQYNDNNNNLIIDDLAASSTYVVNSNNLLIDDTLGVWDSSTKKLKFTFNDINTVTTNISNTLLLYGKHASTFIKVRVYRLISSVAGNSITWNNGFFFNFLSNLRGQYDVEGGVTSKSKHDTDKAALQQNIDNVAASNQQILTSAKNYTDGEVVNTKIYGKAIPTAPTSGTATDIIAGDTLTTIINKIHRWINQFKTAEGIKLSKNFTPASSVQSVNNNDTVDSAFRKVQKSIDDINENISGEFAKVGTTDVETLTTNPSPITKTDTIKQAIQKLVYWVTHITNDKIEALTIQESRLAVGVLPTDILRVDIQSNVDLSDPGKIVAFCKGTSIPSREMGIAEVWIQGRKIPIPGDAQFAGTWDLTFYNDQAHDLRKQFEIWIENLDSYAQHQRGFDATQYFADQFRVHQLDPKDQTTELASWEFYHCFPSALSAVDFGAETNDTVSEFTATITFGHYNRIK